MWTAASWWPVHCLSCLQRRLSPLQRFRFSRFEHRLWQICLVGLWDVKHLRLLGRGGRCLTTLRWNKWLKREVANNPAGSFTEFIFIIFWPWRQQTCTLLHSVTRSSQDIQRLPSLTFFSSIICCTTLCQAILMAISASLRNTPPPQKKSSYVSLVGESNLSTVTSPDAVYSLQLSKMCLSPPLSPQKRVGNVGTMHDSNRCKSLLTSTTLFALTAAAGGANVLIPSCTNI